MNRHSPDHATASILAALALSSAAFALAQETQPVARSRAGEHSLPSVPSAVHHSTAEGHRLVAGTARLGVIQRQYDEALANGQYGEAEAAAKQMIDLMLDAGGHAQKNMADALARLAFAQRHRERYDAALQNYRAAIALLEHSESRLSESLIEPMRGVGDTYMASGRADLAASAYEEALHLRHVNDGPHTLKQVELLNDIATAKEQAGDSDAALDALDRIFGLYARTFAIDSEEVLPVLDRKASLLTGLERHQEARAVYREIIGIMQARRGEYDLSLLQPYSAMARTYFYDLDDVYFRSEPTTETGETFLERALEVAEKNPEATWLMREQALIELGDYYTVRDIQDKARIHYGRAWELLSSGRDRLDRRRRDLGRSVALFRTALDPHADFGYGNDVDRGPEDYLDGYVLVSFTVNARGRVIDVRVADADPVGFTAMEERVTHAVRDFIFRPRYDDGRPVYAHGQLFRHDYRYVESDLEAAN